jgi:hypothetical protein
MNSMVHEGNTGPRARPSNPIANPQSVALMVLVFALGLALAPPLLGARARSELCATRGGDVIEAKEIVVRDDKGRMRIQLIGDTLRMFGPNGKTLVSMTSREEIAGIKLFDSKGVSQLGIVVLPDGEARLYLGQEAGSTALLDQESLTFTRRKQDRIQLSTRDDYLKFAMRDKDGRQRLVAGHIGQGGNDALPFVWLCDRSGKTRLEVGGFLPAKEQGKTNRDRVPMISAKDEKGRQVASWPGDR